MSRRLDIERRRASLADIGEVLGSIKMLAFLESRKLARASAAQQALLEHIAKAGDELLAAEPDLLPPPAAEPALIVVVGSERGFCGDFNRRLAERLTRADGSAVVANARWIVVGRRLQSALVGNPQVAASVDGASVLEDLPAVLDQLVGRLIELRGRQGQAQVGILCHAADGSLPELTGLLPPFRRGPAAAPAVPMAPMLLLPSAELMLELVDQYLFAALNALLCGSLAVENGMRVAHLERATRHLDQQRVELGRKASALRQEEIIEEIEVIMLSAATLAGPDGEHEQRGGAQ